MCIHTTNDNAMAFAGRIGAGGAVEGRKEERMMAQHGGRRETESGYRWAAEQVEKGAQEAEKALDISGFRTRRYLTRTTIERIRSQAASIQWLAG